MAFVSISGEPGCQHDELARIVSGRLGFELVTESEIKGRIAAQFGVPESFPDKVRPHLVRAVVAKLGVERDLVIATTGTQPFLQGLPNILTVHLACPEHRQVSVDFKESTATKEPGAAGRVSFLAEMGGCAGAVLSWKRKGPSSDLILNGEVWTLEQMADVLECAVKSRRLAEAGLLAPAVEEQVQFQVRLKLARYGVAVPDGVMLKRKAFGHPSEEVFASLLDFYRISWDYEPRSFPLQWDKDGRVLEAFTPDFYLPDFDLYIELTTMKQAHVTKKNRKVRLLRAIYPHVNIQVFYQKDVRDLVTKYGSPQRSTSTNAPLAL